MKGVKLAEAISCQSCHGRVKMVDARVLEKKTKEAIRIEFDYACTLCGERASAVLEGEYLPYSERKFCQEKKLPGFESQAKGKGVIHYSKK